MSRCARNILAISISPFPSNCKDAARLRLGCIGDERGQQDLLDLIDYGRVGIIGKAEGNLMPINLKHLFRLYLVHRIPSCVHKIQPRRGIGGSANICGHIPARLYFSVSMQFRRICHASPAKGGIASYSWAAAGTAVITPRHRTKRMPQGSVASLWTGVSKSHCPPCRSMRSGRDSSLQGLR